MRLYCFGNKKLYLTPIFETIEPRTTKRHFTKAHKKRAQYLNLLRQPTYFIRRTKLDKITHCFRGQAEVAIQALQFLDVITMKDPNQKAGFYRGQLIDAMPYIPKV